MSACGVIRCLRMVGLVSAEGLRTVDPVSACGVTEGLRTVDPVSACGVTEGLRTADPVSACGVTEGQGHSRPSVCMRRD